MTSADIWSLFEETYLGRDGIAPRRLQPAARAARRRAAHRRRRSTIDGAERRDRGRRQRADRRLCRRAAAAIAASHCTVLDYHENAVGAGADAQAAAYVQIARRRAATTLYGVGMDSDIVTASLKAVASAATRARKAAH